MFQPYANAKGYKIFKDISLKPENVAEQFEEKYNFLHLIHFDIAPYINIEQSEFWRYREDSEEEKMVYKPHNLSEIDTILHDFDTGNKTMLRTKSLFLNHAFWKENIDLFYVPKERISLFRIIKS